jgi:hypothetical protein
MEKNEVTRKHPTKTRLFRCMGRVGVDGRSMELLRVEKSQVETKALNFRSYFEGRSKREPENTVNGVDNKWHSGETVKNVVYIVENFIPLF